MRNERWMVENRFDMEDGYRIELKTGGWCSKIQDKL